MTGPSQEHSDPVAWAAEDMRDRIEQAHRARREQIRAYSLALHEDPEIAFEEHRACARTTALLEEAGFAVERGTGLPTAFTATLGEGSFTVALCVEYDALPGIGHGCGHNLIAAASVGAALALRDAAADADGSFGDLDLTLQVIGTPAEEHGGGKQLLIDAGVFDQADAALMAHPVPHTDTYDPIGSTSQAVGRWRAVYSGRGAHAAANPADGINANDAAVIAQVAAGLLRQRMRDGQRIALVPQQDGLTNIIPERAVLDVECRALTMPEFEVLRESLFAAVRAGAVATGCELSIEATEPVYEPLRQDELLGRLWNRGMARLGRPLCGSLGIQAASTDMGNVSQRVPSLHPFVGITGADGALHTATFAAHARSEEGLRLMEDAGLTMAWMIRDLAADPEARARLRARRDEQRAAQNQEGRASDAAPEQPSTPGPTEASAP